MLKIKSKAILAFTGLMVAFVMFAGVAVKSASADMVTLPAAGVNKASGISNIQALQTFLNWTLGAQITPLVVDGVYGAKTTAAIKLFQAQNGLSADGKFGPISAAKAMALQANMGGVTYPTGCSSNTGFSSTTGQPCAGGALPAGCSSTMGYSSTTGIPCSTSVGTTLPAGCTSAAGFSSTTGASCTTGTVSTGTNGYLADISSDSTNRVSTVYESEQDKVVAGFRATARLSSQTVNRVRVLIKNTDTVGSSPSLSKYISSASLWYGSTKIATMAVAQADRSTSDDTYTFNFSGLSAMIAQDQIGRFYVSVSANGSLDSTDTTNSNWGVVFPDGGLQAVSPDGSIDTYNASVANIGANTTTSVFTANSGFTFGKFSANGVKATVGLSTTNPNAAIIGVNATSATNGVTLLKFTVKATNSDLTLRKVPVQIVSSGSAAYVTSMINTVKLYSGSNIVDSLDGSAGATVSGSITGAAASCSATGTTCGYLFSNLSSPYNFIPAGTTAEFSVVVDLKSQTAGSYGDGATLTANVQNADVVLTANFGVNDVNGDQLTAGSTYRLGSALGTVQSLYVNGINTVMGTPTYTTTAASAGDITSVTYTIPLTITAFGNDAYIGQTTQLSATASASGAVAFVFQNAAGAYADETSSTASHTITSSGSCAATANALGTGFILPSGTSKCFTVTVVLTTPTTSNTLYRVQLKQVRTFTDAGLGLGAANTNLLPVDAFRTVPVFINN